MTAIEETVADYSGLHLTTGPHMMAHLRPQLEKRGVLTIAKLSERHDGEYVRAAGAVIVRQRPGTARGFVFVTIEDETGLAQAIIKPGLYREHRSFLNRSAILLIEGILQKTEGDPSIKACRFEALKAKIDFESHDYY